MWSKLDDGFYDNPKVKQAIRLGGLAAIGLYCLTLTYCGRHLTNGLVPAWFPKDLEPRAGRRTILVDALVASGLWDSHPDGFLVHDYLKLNPSKDQVETDRERVRNWRRTRTLLVQNPERTASRPDPSRPVPERTKKVQYGEGVFSVPDALLAQWLLAYPAVDVAGEIRRAGAWALANPEKAKKNWQRFLVNWLADKQAKAPKAPPPPEKIRPAVLDTPEISAEQVAANLARVRELTAGIGKTL